VYFERLGMNMSYVAPAVKEKFETLSVDLKNAILERNVELNNIHDLINVLDAIVKEAEDEDKK
jgi:predicted metallopeptidase